MRIGLAEQVRLADRLSIEKYGIDRLELMRRAADAVYQEIIKENTAGKTVCILCGKGNNAGDGFALTSLLKPHCARVMVLLMCGREFSSDAAYYFQQSKVEEHIVDSLPDADIYVDAVFGTGFCGALPDDVANIFQQINDKNAQKIAIDIPSGVQSDSDEFDPNSFVANKTITFEILKYAHVFPKSKALCGDIVVKEIGLSARALEEIDFSTELIDSCILPEKKPDSHKGDNGMLFAITGCKQYQGAAALAVQAALRSGCGIVMAYVPESIYTPVACKTDSAVVIPCPENERGTLSYTSIKKVDKNVRKRRPSAILAGSGMGIDREVSEIVEYVLNTDIPCVIDGDGLRYVRDELLQNRKCATILTPHMGEFSRMIRQSIDVLQRDRFSLCKEYAIRNHVTLVLKDAVTVITYPDGRQKVLSVPNAGMAKGGSGDVLAGMVGSFLAQGMSDEQATTCAVWFHSLAGQITAHEIGTYAMLPKDVIDNLSKAFLQ